MKKLTLIIIIIALIIITLALFAWAPWLTEASAKDSAKAAFEDKWTGVADGASFVRFGDVVKKPFGYEVIIIEHGGFELRPGETPKDIEAKWFVSAFGTVKEIIPYTEGPPTIAPAEPMVEISNFEFSETSSVVDKFKTSIENNKIVFSGPISKPTPCNGLTATSSIFGNTVSINIETTPFEGFCAQVIAETFYTGSFAVSEMPANGIVLNIIYAGETIETATINAGQPQPSKEQACISSGGSVGTSSCCLSASDFPNSCLIGACGCSLENSHSVKTCDCGEGKCFDGTACISSEQMPV